MPEDTRKRRRNKKKSTGERKPRDPDAPRKPREPRDPDAPRKPREPRDPDAPKRKRKNKKEPKRGAWHSMWHNDYDEATWDDERFKENVERIYKTTKKSMKWIHEHKEEHAILELAYEMHTKFHELMGELINATDRDEFQARHAAIPSHFTKAVEHIKGKLGDEGLLKKMVHMFGRVRIPSIHQETNKQVMHATRHMLRLLIDLFYISEISEPFNEMQNVILFDKAQMSYQVNKWDEAGRAHQKEKIHKWFKEASVEYEREHGGGEGKQEEHHGEGHKHRHGGEEGVTEKKMTSKVSKPVANKFKKFEYM